MGLALLLAPARIVIRFHSQKKLYPDDIVLIFACITFIASQAILYTLKIDSLYWHEPMDPQIFYSTLEDPEAFLRRITKSGRMEWSSLALTFAAVFAVKISFLLFFYQMITRLQRLLLAWKVIFGITIMSGAFCISSVFVSCNQFLPAISSSLTILFCSLWTMHLTKHSNVFTRPRAHSAPFCSHHIEFSRYHVGLIP